MQVQAVALDDGVQSSTEELVNWTRVLHGLHVSFKDEIVTDWVQPKPNRVILLGESCIAYVHFPPTVPDGEAEAVPLTGCVSTYQKKLRLRWAVQLKHISSIITVANTIVLLCNEPRQIGPLQLEVPVRRLLSSDQDAMVDLMLHKVNHRLDLFGKRMETESQHARPILDTNRGPRVCASSTRPSYVPMPATLRAVVGQVVVLVIEQAADSTQSSILAAGEAWHPEGAPFIVLREDHTCSITTTWSDGHGEWQHHKRTKQSRLVFLCH
jgi:hypothetical protein